MSLYEKIGENQPEYLLADPQGCDKFVIPCEPGNGVVKRGTVMYRMSNGLWKAASSSEISTSYSLAVIDETVDTNANPAIAEDANAFRAGRLVYTKVLLGSSNLTAAQALILRLQGIMLDQMTDAAAFDNGNYLITYKANNSSTEEDYEDMKKPATAYSVLANSVTKFTAPSTKSFSKWNTKADGTGTDYAAAASYTVDEDLTLYAIWA